MNPLSPDPRPADEDGELPAEMRIAHGIYGVIVSCAVMASAQAESIPRLAVGVLVTLIVYWAAERYAHVMASLIMGGGGIRSQHLRQGWEIVTASFVPLLVLVGSRLVGAEVFTSVILALCSGTGLLMLTGWRVGRGLGLLPRLLSAAAAGAFGVVMIVLKTQLH